MTMTARIQSAVPKIGRDGQQESFVSKQSNQTMYVFVVTLDNGTMGEVNSTTAGQYRHPVGTEVEFTFTPNPNPQYMGKLRLEKPGGQQGGKGWSPEKQVQVEVQGLVQAAIASGARGPQIEALVREGMAETARITKLVLAHRQAQQPAPQPQTFHQPAQNPNPVQYRPDAPPTGSYPAPPPAAPYPAQQPIGHQHDDGSVPF